MAIGMIDQLSYPLIVLSSIARKLISIKPACREMEEFISSTVVAQEHGSEQFSFQREIRFADVSFNYEGGRDLLEQFNLSISKDKRYLITGHSGCGKTTVINLLLKYYEVASGCITIDDVPISQIVSTYSDIAVVRQEAILFCDSLRNNLTMFSNIDDDRLIFTLNTLGLSEYANSQSLDGIITENGANFSGGEKKRICLARAVLRDTNILILDEPLANLDVTTMKKIEELILSIKNRTVIIVSHQFSEEGMTKFDSVIHMA